MQTDAINSAWGQSQAQSKQGGTQNFASHLAASGLAASKSNQPRSGGQLLSDDLSRALASYAPMSGAGGSGA